MDPDYIVIRDPEWSGSGRWYNLDEMLKGPPPPTPEGCESVTFTPTPFIEVREDGAVAQVWMRQPPQPEDGE